MTPYGPGLKTAQQRSVPEHLKQAYARGFASVLEKRATDTSSPVSDMSPEAYNKFKNQFSFRLFPGKSQFSSRIIRTPDGEDWVGYIAVNNKTNEIAAIEVNPKYRGAGYGRQLLDLFPKANSLWTEVENTNAIDFYKHLGFQDTGKRENVHPDDPNQLWTGLRKYSNEYNFS